MADGAFLLNDRAQFVKIAQSVVLFWVRKRFLGECCRFRPTAIDFFGEIVYALQ
jgi:hypothetical protein